MIHTRSLLVARPAMCWHVLAAVGLLAGTAHAESNDGALLAGLAQLEGPAYVAERDRLLTIHPQPWDSEAAARQSWEAGLAAFVLNARLECREGFLVWDAARPRQTAGGVLRYGVLRPHEGITAFFVEKVWKTAENAEMRNLCAENARQGERMGPLALWRAVWESCPLDGLKAIAIMEIAFHDGEEARSLVADALARKDAPAEITLAAAHGLAYTRAGYAAALFVETLPRLARERPNIACYVLAQSLARPEPEVFRMILGIAGDVEQTCEVRCSAIRACTERNAGTIRQEAFPIVQHATGSSSPEKLRLCAITFFARYEISETRETLRRLANEDSSPQLSAAAIRMLIVTGDSSDLDFVERLSGDETITAEIREQAKGALRTKQMQDEQRQKWHKKP